MIKIALITLIFLFGLNNIFSQTVSELEKSRKKLISNIDLTNTYLNKTRTTKTKTLDQYNILSKQIENRQSLINNLTKELKASELAIGSKEEQLSKINNKQKELKADLANIFRTTYKHRLSTSLWTRLLSATNFREAFMRLQYTKQFEQYSTHQLSLLKDQADSINILVTEIDKELSKKKSLLSEENKQTKSLNSELNQKNSAIKKLEKEETKLLKELKQQNKERLDLNKLISLSISREISNSSSEDDNVELSSSFAHNKGKLPWPVKNGIISKQFGKRNHPTNKNVIIDNDGIDIRTEDAGIVKSIFDGQVASVNQIPGFYQVVIVKSGEYFIVYGRLSSTNVTAGENIVRGTTLGELAIKENKSELQLQMWKGQTKLNPSHWLIRK